MSIERLKTLFSCKADNLNKEIDSVENQLKSLQDKLNKLKEIHPIDLMREELKQIIDNAIFNSYYNGLRTSHFDYYRHANVEGELEVQKLKNKINELLEDLVNYAKDKK